MKNLINKLNKRNIVILLIVVAGLIGLTRPKTNQSDEFMNPYKGDIREEIRGSGVLNASSLTKVYSQTKGVIKNIYVTNGQMVKSGDKLFEVSSTATEQERAAAWAGYASARAGVNTAQSAKTNLQTQLEAARKAILDATNQKNILDENLTNQKNNPATNKSYTEAEKLAIESNLISARNNFASLEKQYMNADESIGAAQASATQTSLAYQATKDSVVKSTVTGKVFNLKLATGDSVGSVLDDEVVLMVGDTDEMTIQFKVSEFNVGKIKVGQETLITFDALPSLTLKGVVGGVDQVGETSLGTVTFGVLVRVQPTEEEAKLIRPSMTANLSIVTNSKNDVWLIPRSAVKLTGGKYYVIKQNGEQKDIEVSLGIIGDDVVEVISGIDQNMKIKKVFSH